MKIIKYFFEFTSIISLFCIFKIIGLRNASSLGGVLGRFIGPLFRSKKIIKENIKTGLGEIDAHKETEIIKEPEATENKMENELKDAAPQQEKTQTEPKKKELKKEKK